MQSLASWSVLSVLLLALAPVTFTYAGGPVELAQGTPPEHPQQPQLAISADGTVHVVYGRGNRVLHRRSDDRGASFAPPTELQFAPTMSLGMRRGPRVAAVGEHGVCIAAIGGERGRGQDGDVWAMHSVDGGRSWKGPVRVNDVPGAAREGLHALASGPDGRLCCVWLDLRHGKTQLWAATSTDGGEMWSENVPVYASPDGSICECCHPSATFDNRGHLWVQWRNSVGGERDIYLAKSTDGGRSFSAAQKQGAGAWKLNACPMDGGAVAVDAKGRYYAAWRRHQQVFLTGDDHAQEKLLGSGEQPWIAATDNGPLVLWVTRRAGPLQLWRPDAEKAQELAARASDPVIAVSLDGRGPVIAAWEARDGETQAVHVQALQNGTH